MMEKKSIALIVLAVLCGLSFAEGGNDRGECRPPMLNPNGCQDLTSLECESVPGGYCTTIITDHGIGYCESRSGSGTYQISPPPAPPTTHTYEYWCSPSGGGATFCSDNTGPDPGSGSSTNSRTCGNILCWDGIPADVRGCIWYGDSCARTGSGTLSCSDFSGTSGDDGSEYLCERFGCTWVPDTSCQGNACNAHYGSGGCCESSRACVFSGTGNDYPCDEDSDCFGYAHIPPGSFCDTSGGGVGICRCLNAWGCDEVPGYGRCYAGICGAATCQSCIPPGNTYTSCTVHTQCCSGTCDMGTNRCTDCRTVGQDCGAGLNCCNGLFCSSITSKCRSNSAPAAPVAPTIASVTPYPYNTINCVQNCPPVPGLSDPEGDYPVEIRYLWFKQGAQVGDWSDAATSFDCNTFGCQPGDDIYMLSKGCDSMGLCGPSSAESNHAQVQSPPPPPTPGPPDVTYIVLAFMAAISVLALAYMASYVLEMVK